MRVMIVHNYYQQAGGEDSVVADEIKLLRQHGDDVATFYRHNDDIKGMSKLRVAEALIWNKAAARELGRAIAEHGSDVAHFHNTFPLISPAAYRAAHHAGAAVAQTLHNYRLTCANALLCRDDKVCELCVGKTLGWPGIVHRCYRDSTLASAGVAVMTATHRVLGTYRRSVDAYIALSEFGRRRFIAAGLPAETLHIKPNFAFPRGGVGHGEGGYAMFLGRLAPDKGIGVLLDAWRKLDGRVPLRIVGDGPLREQVVAAAASIPGVTWLGRLGDPHMWDTLADASFLIVPSLTYEGFPRVIVESYCVGTPVLASRQGALQEWVIDGKTGLHVTPGNADDLAEKSRALFADLPRQKLMRQASRALYEEQLSPDTNYQILQSIYAAARARRDRAVRGAAPPRPALQVKA